MTTHTTARFLNQSPHGFSNVVEVPPGRLVFVTGQMSVDATNQLVGAGDFAAQVEHVFENLVASLAAADATFEHVIKLETLAVAEEFTEHMYTFGEVRDRYINRESPPASAITLVPKLVHPGALIDIAVIAHLPN
jgi:enamine deaminase RidA (YjgF/YER057c/UK114 family)